MKLHSGAELSELLQHKILLELKKNVTLDRLHLALKMDQSLELTRKIEVSVWGENDLKIKIT